MAWKEHVDQESNGKWSKIKNKYGARRTTLVAYLLFVGVISLLIHILFIGGLGHSSLLYMLIPYSVSLVIALLTSDSVAKTNGEKYLQHIGIATLVFLATSIVLREGFICVLFFYPIYFIIVSIAYGAKSIFSNKNKLNSVAVPILIGLMSLEGTSSILSFDRATSVKIVKKSSLSTDQIKHNLAKPFNLEKDRHWILSIFPMPYHIEAGSLNEGDVHNIKTRYKRWFFTNTHEGEARLLISSVKDNLIKTKLISDTTYFSSYLNLEGTKIQLQPLEGGETNVVLTIDYKRKLDPAWYFHPLQKLAVSKMGEFLIDEIMIRNE